MAGFEILDELEPLNPGRLLLNHMYSAMTIYWSGNTGTDSLIRNNNTQNLKNRAGGSDAFAGGVSNEGASTFSFALWGSGNTAHTAYSTVLHGKINSASGHSSSILNGSGNTIRAHYSIIGNGVSNRIDARSVHGVILSGYWNRISGTSYCSVIIGGSGNTIYGEPASLPSHFSSIIGGTKNTIGGIPGPYYPIAATILGGAYNKVETNFGVATGFANITSMPYGVTMGSNGILVSNPFTLSIAGTASPFPNPNSTNNSLSFHGDLGEGYAEGGFITGPADIAEMFRFEDNNPNSEDRRGLFVSLTSGGTIKVGNENIIGIVSANPGYVGDSADLKWAGIYIKDELGGRLKETFTIFSWIQGNKKFKVFQSTDGTKYKEYPSPSFPEGVIYENIEIPENATIQEFTTYKINPNFNPQQEYEPRSKRKEWVPVGLLGKIHVRTAEPIIGTHVDVDENGMAINGTTYAIIKHIEPFKEPYGIVQIFMK